MSLRIATVLARITYKDWGLRTGDINTSNPWMQWVFQAPCAKTGKIEAQFCRKVRLSENMTDGEIVQSAFMAALQAEEHECREFFQYNGHRIFNPHMSLAALVSRAHEDEPRNPTVKRTDESWSGWHNEVQKGME
jgi:hypothetical protein